MHAGHLIVVGPSFRPTPIQQYLVNMSDLGKLLGDEPCLLHCWVEHGDTGTKLTSLHGRSLGACGSISDGDNPVGNLQHESLRYVGWNGPWPVVAIDSSNECDFCNYRRVGTDRQPIDRNNWNRDWQSSKFE